MTKYSAEDIEKVQNLCSQLMYHLSNDQEVILKNIEKNRPSNYHYLSKLLYDYFYEKTDSRTIFTRIGKRDKPLFSGVGTFLSFYITLFLLSKGIEKHGFKISSQLFRQLPFFSFEYLEYNSKVVGNTKQGRNYAISTHVPILIDSEFIFGKGACPLVHGKKGMGLNINSYQNFNTFFEKLYTQILKRYEIQFQNMPREQTPDFVNILLGRFDSIKYERLRKRKDLFESL